MNKAYKYTLTANERKEITFDVGVNRLAISNANGYDYGEDLTQLKEDVDYLSENAEMIPEDVYGLDFDFDTAKAVRLGGASGKTAGADFDSIPIWNRRRCNVADNGIVNAYYGDETYTEDGSNGQVMVEQQPVYYKIVPMRLTKNTDSGIGYHGNRIRYFVSPYPREGFKLHPAFYNVPSPIYLSVYEGSYFDTALDRIFNDDTDTSTTINTGDKLCSIGNNTKPISGLHKNLNKVNLETIAQNRGVNWHLETIQVNMLNILLFAIEYASFNSQNKIGAGVTGISDNASYNCASLTGSTASLGNASGRATSTINEQGATQTTETVNGKVSVTYRGVENVWGNIWKHINGINIYGNGSQAGGQLFVNSALSGFNEQTTSSPYATVAVTMPNTNGYVKYFGFDQSFDWLFIPSKVGSGADTAKPVGDYCYVTSNLNGYRIARSGGTWATGESAGASYWNVNDSNGTSGRYIGGRLMYIPHSYFPSDDDEYELLNSYDNQVVQDGWSFSNQGYSLSDAEELLFVLAPSVNVAKDNDTINGELQWSSNDAKRGVFSRGVKNILPDAQNVESPFFFEDIVLIGNTINEPTVNGISMRIRVWCYYNLSDPSLADVAFYADCKCNGDAKLWPSCKLFIYKKKKR